MEKMCIRDRVKTDPERMRQEIKEIYRQVPSMYGLALPQDYQHPKQVWFNPLYSGVGVLGYMGPFFAESQLNEEMSSESSLSTLFSLVSSRWAHRQQFRTLSQVWHC